MSLRTFNSNFSATTSTLRSALRPYLQGRQAVVVCKLLGLLITQVLDSQAEPQLLKRHRRHIVGHVINLRIQRERWEALRTHHTCYQNVCIYLFQFVT